MARFSSIRCSGRELPLAIVMTLATAIASGSQSSQPIGEYQLKAAYLYNVAKFVEWPSDTFKTPKDPIVSCILGESPLRSALEDAAREKTVEGRSFVVRQIADGRQAAGCHILFVSSSQRKRWHAMAADMKPVGVLTVGETDGFASEGGVVNFKLEGEKVRIQINVDSAERGGLRISSKLLSLSQIVKK